MLKSRRHAGSAAARTSSVAVIAGDSRGSRVSTADTAQRQDWLKQWAGKRSNRWIARHIGCTPSQVWFRCNHYRVAPTLVQGCVTASQAARVLGVKPQAVSKRCRKGTLPAHKNPQRRRWDRPIRRPSTPAWQIRIDDLVRVSGLSVREVVLRLAGE